MLQLREPGAPCSDWPALPKKAQAVALAGSRDLVCATQGYLREEFKPSCEGKVEGVSCVVYRDTGCQCVVVQESLVPARCILPSTRRIALINGQVKEYPTARVKIGSPFFSGTIRAAVIKTARVKIGSPFFSGTIWAVVIKTPIFPCIIGNVEGARKLQFLNRRSDKATSTPDAAAVEKGAGRESPPALGQGPTDDIRSSPEPVVPTEAQVGPVWANDAPSKESSLETWGWRRSL